MERSRTAARAVDRQGCGSPSTPKAQPEGARHRAPCAASSARTGDNNGCAVLVAAPARDLTRLSGSTRGTRRQARPDTSLRGSSHLRTRGSDANASPGSATPHARSRGGNPGSRHTEGSPTPAGVSESRRWPPSVLCAASGDPRCIDADVPRPSSRRSAPGKARTLASFRGDERSSCRCALLPCGSAGISGRQGGALRVRPCRRVSAGAPARRPPVPLSSGPA